VVVGRWTRGLGAWVLALASVQAFAEDDMVGGSEPTVEVAVPSGPDDTEKSAAIVAPVDPAVPQPGPPAEAASIVEQDRDASPKRYAAEVLSFDKWENALSIKSTSMFNRKAADFSSPTVLLTAEWNYHFRTDTYFGLALSGAPQKANISSGDRSTRKYTTYYGGLDLAQSIYSSAHYRAVLQVAAGYGVVYLRTTPEYSTTSNIDKPQYNFIEPGAFFTFCDFKDLDVGLVFTYRYARLIVKSTVVSSSDVTSATFGLTFRNRHH